MGVCTLFLKIVVDGNPIEGESQSEGYEKQIEVESFSWQTQATITTDKSASSGHAVTLEQTHLKLNKFFDSSTGLLCKVAATEPPRKRFSTALLTMVSMSKERAQANHRVLELLLSDGHIEEVTLNASEGGHALALRETVTLSFRKSELRYFPMSHVVTGARAQTPQMTFVHDFAPAR